MAVHVGVRGPGHLSRTFQHGGLAPYIAGTPTAATQNVAYSWTPSVGGGIGPYTFSITAGALPTGLSLNASTGAVTGTPTAVTTASGITVHMG
jgi:hypothetical protein